MGDGDIISNFYWIYRLFRMCAYNNFHMPKNRNVSIRLNSFDIAVNVLSVFVIALLTVYNSNVNVSDGFSKSFVVNLGYRATMVATATEICCLMFIDILNRKKIWFILTGCYDFDQQVFRLLFNRY